MQGFSDSSDRACVSRGRQRSLPFPYADPRARESYWTLGQRTCPLLDTQVDDAFSRAGRGIGEIDPLIQVDERLA